MWRNTLTSRWRCWAVWNREQIRVKNLVAPPHMKTSALRVKSQKWVVLKLLSWSLMDLMFECCCWNIQLSECLTGLEEGNVVWKSLHDQFNVICQVGTNNVDHLSVDARAARRGRGGGEAGGAVGQGVGLSLIQIFTIVVFVVHPVYFRSCWVNRAEAGEALQRSGDNRQTLGKTWDYLSEVGL